MGKMDTEANILYQMRRRDVAKKLVLLAYVIAFAGLLYSGALLLLNIFLPFGKIPYITQDGVNLMQVRIMIREITEYIYNISEVVYLGGNVLVIGRFISHEYYISIKKVIMLLIVTSIVTIFYSFVFSLANRPNAIDYFYPAFNMIGNTVTIIGFTCIADVVGSKRKKNQRF